MLKRTLSSLSAPNARPGLILARYRRGWSQQKVADRVGTTRLNVSRWERGLTTPNPYFRHSLIELFGVSDVELDLIDGAGLEALAVPEAGEASSVGACYDPLIPFPTSCLSLVGRHEELSRIKEYLVHPQVGRLLALSGLPGVGKTALAAALARDAEIRDSFADGVLWAHLGPAPQMQDILSRWGRLLGVSQEQASQLSSVQEWGRVLRGCMGPRRMLLVLDDGWGEQEVQACRVGGPGCSYVLTTRSPLLARRFTFDGFFPVAELDEEAGLLLVEELAPEAAALEPELVRTLVRGAGGLPLGLMGVGYTLRLHSYNGQSRRIRAALSALQAGQQLHRLHLPLEPVSSSARTAISLEAAIEVSEQQLTEKGRAALYALSVFAAKPASFTEEAALTVSQQPEEALDELSDAGLLESVEAGRYSLHPTIVDYGRARLADSDAKRRLARYGMRYAQQYRDDYAALERESALVEAAREAAIELGEWEIQK